MQINGLKIYKGSAFSDSRGKFSRVFDSDFKEEVDDFYEMASENLHKDFLRQFLKQYSLIEKHSDTKNLKNYYLILSILFQILGLTFLLLLFKELIMIFNKRKVK